MRLIGVLMGVAESDPAWRSLFAAFRDALAKVGWTEGGNLRIELRWGAGGADRMRTLAKELVDLRPDAIVRSDHACDRRPCRETQTIPIVFVNVSDPIGSGFVTNFARPGGNITGLSLRSESAGKWLELLREVVPGRKRVALFQPGKPSWLKAECRYCSRPALISPPCERGSKRQKILRRRSPR